MEGVLQTQKNTVSVIVPVYKVEKYLEACIDSIIAQTFRDFELILVDDGSPDRCGAICDEYAQNDPRITVIHQENIGLSGARNTGMDVAKGEYITFVDSDDLIVPQYLESLIGALVAADADLSVCSPKEFADEESKNNIQMYIPTGFSVISGKDACIRIYNGDLTVPVNACGKLFRASLVQDARFPIGRLHEDQAFVPPLCYRAEKVAVLGTALYRYRVRDDSITRELFTLKRYDDVWAIDRCIAFFKEEKADEIVEAAEGKRKRLLATYSIYAKRDCVEVPKEFHVKLLPALRYLKKNVSQSKYEYYLMQALPMLVKPYAYLQKLKRMFGKRTVKGNKGL